jgi:D-alanine-D-alanine ligase
MVESFIPGRELTVGVMGDRALAVTDILADAGQFYDY